MKIPQEEKSKVMPKRHPFYLVWNLFQWMLKPFHFVQNQIPETNHLPKLNKEIKKEPNSNSENKIRRNLLTVASSEIGTSHIKSGTPCQDASGIKTIGSNIVIGVSSDGAGSAAMSEEGSKLVVEKSLKLAEEYIGKLQERKETHLVPSQKQVEYFSQYLVQKLRDALKQRGEELKQPFKALACTLNLFITTPNWLIVVQVGDGFTVVYPSDNEKIPAGFHLVFKPNRGQFVNEVSAFITSRNVFKEIQSTVFEGYFPFILQASDGLDDVAIEFKDWKPYPNFFKTLWEQLFSLPPQMLKKAVSQLLNSDSINKHTYDDKSLVIALDQGFKPEHLVAKGFIEPLSQSKNTDSVQQKEENFDSNNSDSSENLVSAEVVSLLSQVNNSSSESGKNNSGQGVLTTSALIGTILCGSLFFYSVGSQNSLSNKNHKKVSSYGEQNTLQIGSLGGFLFCGGLSILSLLSLSQRSSK